ncbi:MULTISPECIES: class I SAM-dependent methyltransferase [unclassified Colwellia]|uniref:class I SAM-dependent methyltransferase n=1 Tax=unclassified Colwellia TaxID=196834 RepID=UPI0015F406AB|nr:MULTISPECIES: class I SAM-dependent methyltransferase [unclassified Colwellia]MBA6257506.1 class I SAM-dependent methyltransferase [Colwellia sp. MB3u-28]MBA6260578.1 class I SAM-dependent methyltransferase [Colwellia sp. MB3u-41]MBA6304855.1 class I SAM-dependent methyltransferase [Colwellia sp. MB02u-14]
MKNWMLISIYLLFVSLNTSALENNTDLNVGIKAETKANILSMQTIEAVLNDDKRTKPDYLKDEHRKPTEILTFFNVTPETVVLDVLAGSGYYSEILSGVVGSKGKVIIHNDKHFLKYYGKSLSERLGNGERLANTKRIDISLNNLELEENSIDTILLILGYHDFYYVMDGAEKIAVEKVLSNFRRFLKPNGIIGIIDHEAVKGAPSNVGNTLHRIDPQIVKSEMSDAGFVFDGELDILKNTRDDKSKKIWDIPNSNTSRFVLRFKNLK